MERLYKPSEVAEMFNASTSCIYKKAEKGQIESTKIGSLLRFTEKQIADYIEKSKRKSTNVSK
jgi:excisionase family DNA binding protein